MNQFITHVHTHSLLKHKNIKTKGSTPLVNKSFRCVRVTQGGGGGGGGMCCQGGGISYAMEGGGGGGAMLDPGLKRAMSRVQEATVNIFVNRRMVKPYNWLVSQVCTYVIIYTLIFYHTGTHNSRLVQHRPTETRSTTRHHTKCLD